MSTLNANAQPLTDEDSRLYGRIVALVNDQYVNAEPALIAATLNGVPVTVIAAVSDDGTGGASIEPMAVIVTDAVFDMLEEPITD